MKSYKTVGCEILIIQYGLHRVSKIGSWQLLKMWMSIFFANSEVAGDLQNNYHYQNHNFWRIQIIIFSPSLLSWNLQSLAGDASLPSTKWVWVGGIFLMLQKKKEHVGTTKKERKTRAQTRTQVLLCVLNTPTRALTLESAYLILGK